MLGRDTTDERRRVGKADGAEGGGCRLNLRWTWGEGGREMALCGGGIEIERRERVDGLGRGLSDVRLSFFKLRFGCTLESPKGDVLVNWVLLLPSDAPV